MSLVVNPKINATSLAAAAALAKEYFSRTKYTGGFDREGYAQPGFVYQRTLITSYHRLIDKACNVLAVRHGIRERELFAAIRAVGQLTFAELEGQHKNESVLDDLIAAARHMRTQREQQQTKSLYVR